MSDSTISRTIIIGDVHGCYDEVIDLFNKLGVTSNDEVIFAGDLVDRGPKRRECVELAMQHTAILGNHEEKHLWMWKRRPADIKTDHLNTQKVLDDKHLDYFSTLPTYLRLPEYNVVVVHAGVMPYVPIEKQADYILLHGQYIKPPTIKSYWPSKAPPGYSFWTNHWQGPEVVVFGHTVLDKPLISKYAIGVDTGCVHGRQLSALVLPDWKVVSVPARKEYWQSRRMLKTFPVMGDVNCYS